MRARVGASLKQRQDVTARLLKRSSTTVLSKFIVTRRCLRPDSGHHETETEAVDVVVDEWVEFIEPLTLHARHPMALASCQHIPAVRRAFPAGGVPIMDVDYLLLQSSSDLYRPRPGHFPNSSGDIRGNHRGSRGVRDYSLSSFSESPVMGGKRNQHLLIDAGSSTFDSSLAWFTCAYSQVRLPTLEFSCSAGSFLDVSAACL
jgi:hypothetical protein